MKLEFAANKALVRVALGTRHLWCEQHLSGHVGALGYNPPSEKRISLSTAMSIPSLVSSCAINAERRSGRVLLQGTNIVLTFRHASLSMLSPFNANGVRRFSFVFQPHLEGAR